MNMRKILLFFICILSFVTITKTTYATHVAGADITYKRVGVDSFLITVSIFEDCAGSATVSTSIDVRFTNTCGFANFNVSFPRISVSEVSQLCPAEQPNSWCNGGTLPGMRQKVFQKIVVLQPCASWRVVWGVANRNASVNLDPPGNNYYFAVDAEINSIAAPINQSPVFNSQPIPYVCANQLVNYSFGVSELDGDSLVYSFDSPLGGSLNNPTILTYQPGYSVNQPLPGIILDPVSGMLSFTPTLLGNFVLVVKVEEYRNGNLIGFVKRDIQFVVRSCTNTPPDISAGIIDQLTGNAVQIGPYSIEMCEGNTFTFIAKFVDQDPADVLSIVSNLATVLPGSTINITGDNPLFAEISWTAPATSSGMNTSFSITVSDGACPIPGIQNYIYNIEVVPSTLIVPGSVTLCTQGDSVQLTAVGGTNFTWYDLSGNTIPSGAQFSCNNCPNPIAKPTVTTTYIVESDLSNTCSNRDTITVTIAPPFTLVAVGDTVVCQGGTVQFNAQTTNGGAPYTYSWSPPGLFTNPNISNPTVTFPNTGNFSIILSATSAQGCLKLDTLNIAVVPAPVFTINSYGPICSNTLPINLDYSPANPNYTELWSGAGISDSLTGIFNPTLAGPGIHTISLTLSAPGGNCTETQTTTIEVIAGPDATLTLNDTIFCSGDQPVQITTATPGGTWNTVPGLNSSGTFNPSIAPIGTSVITYSFSGVCPHKDSVIVVVNQTPQPPTLSQNQTVCSGTNLPPGSVSATGIPGGTISWYLNSELQGLVNFGETFNGQFTSSGTIYAYDSLNGCRSNVASLMINFYPKPTASFFIDPANGRGTIPFNVTLTNNSTGYSWWQWTFGDSSNVDTTNFNTTHTYTSSGIYRILLTVRNSFGCTDTMGFTVVPEEELIIPNVFTPNRDGVNDEFYFQIDPNTVNSFKAIIFDRWGKKVIEFNNVRDKWDGGNYPAGTYYYIIEATDINNQPFKHTHGYFKMMK